MKLGNAKVSAQIFTYQELVVATQNFNPNCLVGEGGFGRVYKGYLESIDQVHLLLLLCLCVCAIYILHYACNAILCFILFFQAVAVKQLDRNGMQGNREFFSEVLTLSLVQHPNLVKLIGYCVDNDHRILVYEFLPNGSLENHLLGMPKHNM